MKLKITANFSLEVFNWQLAVSVLDADHQIYQHLHHVFWITIVNLCERYSLFDDLAFSKSFCTKMKI